METNVTAGKWVMETWENGVASQHVANGVKCAWMIIWSFVRFTMIQELDGMSTDLILK